MTHTDRAGRTPLHYAAQTNDVDTLHQLLSQGMDPDHTDRAGFTALHFAAQQGAAQACQVLLDAGASVDLANAHGNTPLWVAVFHSHGRGDIIHLLRKHGADPHHINNAGNTPIDLTHKITNHNIAQYFADLDDTNPPTPD